MENYANTQGTFGGNVTVGLPDAPLCGLTLGQLIDHYRTDPESTWHSLRYHVRKNHETLLKRLVDDYGGIDLTMIDTRDVKAWYRNWTSGGKIATGQAFIGKLRTIATHGVLMLPRGMARLECGRIKEILRNVRVQHGLHRQVFLTAPQVMAIRAKAHEWGAHSIALAQALQFELVFRQKDILGEWIPDTEPGETDVKWKGLKWLRGLRWSEIDENMILRHVTSKRGKAVTHNLNLSPMVIEELRYWQDHHPNAPVVICEATAMPWSSSEFRKKWRKIARAVGIPDSIRNMDSRSGGMTEGKQAGAHDHTIQKAATHSNFAMTAKYIRNDEEMIEEFQRKRIAHREALTSETVLKNQSTPDQPGENR